ncbi:hypothetical protein T4E_3088 [Trichinella pseudospiralis]|uniref:Uncharacterized protein n=1 Tax=Trichinella pseudospiralis TaxID=6337 RepID=A0A0V0YCJ5_TRIPS|nr:hypothetical protein T4E_3088 [Trichinella pseudospiralis]
MLCNFEEILRNWRHKADDNLKKCAFSKSPPITDCAAAVRSISFCSPRRARLYFITRFKHPGRSDESDDAFKQYGRTVEQGARPVLRDVALLTTCQQSAASRKQLSNLT